MLCVPIFLYTVLLSLDVTQMWMQKKCISITFSLCVVWMLGIYLAADVTADILFITRADADIQYNILLLFVPIWAAVGM